MDCVAFVTSDLHLKQLKEMIVRAQRQLVNQICLLMLLGHFSLLTILGRGFPVGLALVILVAILIQLIYLPSLLPREPCHEARLAIGL